MIVLWVWIIGWFLTTLLYGVLYKRGIWKWSPSGAGGALHQPPHMLVALFWPMHLAGWIVYKIFITTYNGFGVITDWLSKVSIERKEK